MIESLGYRTIAGAAALLSLFSVACSGDASKEAASGPNTCGLSADDMGNLSIVANEANDYAFASSFSIDVTPVVPSSELTFDWSGVTTDFLGRTLDPLVDIDMVTLVMWNLSQSELETNLNDDTLSQRDVGGLAMIYTEDVKTSGGLFEFTSFGMPLEQSTLLTYLDVAAHDPATHAYTIMAVTGTMAGKGTRMLQSFRLDPTTDNTHVAVDSSSATLTYDADLTNLVPVHVPAGEADLAVDWTDMTVNALGHEFLPTSIDDVLVAHYDLTPAEMEARFLELDLIATDTWRGAVPSGTSAVLSSLSNEAGEPFPGIDETGTWIVALFCGDCANPAPWYISILEPCTASSSP